MKRRNPYSDLGLTLAIAVFLCIVVKSILFGMTWVGILWIIISCAYFFVSWKYPSDSKIVRHSTTTFIILSVMAIAGIIMFDKNARPKMHAFEGTGDTIQDQVIDAEGPHVDMLDDVTSDPAADSTSIDTTLFVSGEAQDAQESAIESENNSENKIDTIFN